MCTGLRRTRSESVGSETTDEEKGFVVTPKPMDAGSVTTRQERADGGISDHPDCPSDDRCNPEQMRGTCEPPKGTLQGGREVRSKE